MVAVAKASSPAEQVIANKKAVGRKVTTARFLRPAVHLFPSAQEIIYRNYILNIVTRLDKKVKEVLMPQLPTLIDDAKQLRGDSVRLDAWADTLAELMNQLSLSLESDANISNQVVNTFAGVSAFNKAQISKIVEGALGVDIFASEPSLLEEAKSFSRENASLITNMQQSYLDDIQGIANRGLRQGIPFRRIEQEIIKKTKVTKSRARLIARDQVAKLNGQLTGLRQKNLGVTRYVWRTVADESVRPTHRSKNGKVFSWDDPPEDTGHPGQDFRCRCYAEPVFTDLL